MCSLNVSLQSNIIPKYFNLLTCGIILLFNYTATSFCSFRFLLVSISTFDLSSLNLILLSFAQVDILSNSTLAMFYGCVCVCVLCGCMCVCFVMGGCFGNSVSDLVMCTCIYCVLLFPLCIFYSFLFVCTSVRTTATE